MKFGEVRIAGQWYSATASDGPTVQQKQESAEETGAVGTWQLPVVPAALRGEIARLENTMLHLRRSNLEMAEADPSPRRASVLAVVGMMHVGGLRQLLEE